MEEHVQSAWGWLGAELRDFGVRWLVVIMIGLITGGFIGKRYRALKRDVADLRAQLAQPAVTVNVEAPAPHPTAGALVDPTAGPGRSGSPDKRLRDLEPLIAEHVTGGSFPRNRIWELHLALGEIGIPWPGPGVTPAFRRAISEEILAACRDGDLERATAAWASVTARDA